MAEVKWTKEQEKAIFEKGSDILVAAAAGSGKTAVLVERIIKKIINDGVDIDKLLVVTFTNAAASEMRERIADRIYKEIENKPVLQKQISLQFIQFSLFFFKSFYFFSLNTNLFLNSCGIFPVFLHYTDLL